MKLMSHKATAVLFSLLVSAGTAHSQTSDDVWSKEKPLKACHDNQTKCLADTKAAFATYESNVNNDTIQTLDLKKIQAYLVQCKTFNQNNQKFNALYENTFTLECFQNLKTQHNFFKNSTATDAKDSLNRDLDQCLEVAVTEFNADLNRFKTLVLDVAESVLKYDLEKEMTACNAHTLLVNPLLSAIATLIDPLDGPLIEAVTEMNSRIVGSKSQTKKMQEETRETIEEVIAKVNATVPLLADFCKRQTILESIRTQKTWYLEVKTLKGADLDV